MIALLFSAFCLLPSAFGGGESTFNPVLRLGDEFIELSKEGSWLVSFYAPWCGHCKQLKPTWTTVGQTFAVTNSKIRVAVIDGTKSTRAMDHFNVRGFPTIKFFRNGVAHTFSGPRTVDEIVTFAKRADGPAVKKASSSSELQLAIKENDVLFVLTRAEEQSGIHTKYTEIAEEFVLHGVFYEAAKKYLPTDVKVQDEATCIVFKDGNHFILQTDDGVITKSDMRNFIVSERFQAFPKISRDTLYQYVATGKLLVLAILNKGTGNYRHPHTTFKENVKSIAVNERDDFHSDFQFGFMEGNQDISDITMSTIEVPGLVVLNTETQVYHIMNEVVPSSKDSIKYFLHSVTDGTAKAYGGNSLFRMIYRVFYEFATTALAIWKAQPVIISLVIILPGFLITFICYTICTSETIDEDIEDSDFEEDEDGDKFEEHKDKKGEGEGEEKHLKAE
ncbi:protein disulfide-isomerase TMX3-like [Anneissia japonica]|uniref:protein disulfide-isomerase TMX3-like n=1 Tax=Anneissia japonica TaxID=1529436 RepID=UPI001425B31C|nr:protein disulfide-isomerase TMX3-like [Anneissia japonica]